MPKTKNELAARTNSFLRFPKLPQNTSAASLGCLIPCHCQLTTQHHQNNPNRLRDQRSSKKSLRGLTPPRVSLTRGTLMTTPLQSQYNQVLNPAHLALEQKKSSAPGPCPRCGSPPDWLKNKEETSPKKKRHPKNPKTKKTVKQHGERGTNPNKTQLSGSSNMVPSPFYPSTTQPAKPRGRKKARGPSLWQVPQIFFLPEAPGTFNGRPNPSTRHPGGWSQNMAASGPSIHRIGASG